MSTIPLQYAPPAVAERSEGRAWGIVIMLGIAHMVVDSATVFTACRVSVLYTNPDISKAIWVISAYNLLAFATQPLTGWLVDAIRMPARAGALGGFMAAGAALFWQYDPMLAVGVAAIGNSLFHVGAGSVTLRLARGRAAMPGVFVGPGDMGVIIGAMIGWGMWTGLPFVIVGCVAVSVMTAVLASAGEGTGRTAPTRIPLAVAMPGRGLAWLAIAAVLLCFAIGVRSYMGGGLTEPWLTSTGVWIGIALAAIAAKAIGGFVADRFGWLPTAAGCAALAAPFVAMRGGSAEITIAAMFLVQAAMPITLAATARVFAGRPGLAFGLASFSISIASPVAARLPFLAKPTMGVLLGVQLACAGAVVAALVIIRPRSPLPQ